MKNISMFDVIGPNMIGPSSSHTAGALKIALLARKMSKEHIIKAEFILYGSFASTYKGHGTDRALVAGILGFGTEDYRIKDAFLHAEQMGLTYTFQTNTEKKEIHPNTVDIILTSDSGEITKVTGVSIGGGSAEIREINGVEINLSGEYSTILIKQRDIPGVVAHITKCLSDGNINIAYMKLYREDKGRDAYTIVEADEKIQLDVIAKIEENQAIRSAILIE